MPRKKQPSKLSEENLQKKALAESDFEEFIHLVQPKRWLGSVHREVIRWITSQEASKYQLLLLPRDHMKSAIAALYAVWELTRDPTIRILYISSTSNLAVKQLKFMKDVLTSDIYMATWPEMVNKEEAKREKWTEREISVDHPLRREFYVRDPSIFTAGLTSNIVGLHCDIIILDDVVVQGNAYTEEGREKVKDQYSFLASVATINAKKQLVVGTRYHPKDLYGDLIAMEIDTYDDLGQSIARQPLFEIKEYPVEVGGQFLWPREKQLDGRWYGFDARTLEEKKNLYINKVHFRAQYYNDPNSVDDAPIKRGQFQYYDPVFLNRKDGKWFFREKRLNVVAAIDFAYSLGKKADYTAIAVVGVSGTGDYYVLDIDRFKTQKHSEYFDHILKLYEKWGFRKLRAEVNVAQIVIVKDLKESYIKPLGLSLTVEEFRPSMKEGSKEERILAVLEPKYANGQIWHYSGGNCQILEEELIFANPAHDDVKDALASAIDFGQGLAPLNTYTMQKKEQEYHFHHRFGGVI